MRRTPGDGYQLESGGGFLDRESIDLIDSTAPRQIHDRDSVGAIFRGRKREGGISTGQGETPFSGIIRQVIGGACHLNAFPGTLIPNQPLDENCCINCRANTLGEDFNPEFVTLAGLESIAVDVAGLVEGPLNLARNRKALTVSSRACLGFENDRGCCDAQVDFVGHICPIVQLI